MKTTGKSKRILILASVIIGLTGIFLCTSCAAQQTTKPPNNNPTSVVAPPAATSEPAESLTGVDDILHHALSSSMAYNAPETMQLNETATIQLLLNPSVTEAELGQQIEESGVVTTGTIQVTPLMKAELIAPQGTFAIVPLHDTAEQPLSATQTTRWQWQITAKQEGTQHLTLIVYMLINYDGTDYWREVETYRNDIVVNVTFLQRIETFDWKWLIGIIVGSGALSFIWRWVKKRLPRKASS